MGRRLVRFSYQVDVEVEAVIEWPDSAPAGDDPREVTRVKGETPRDQGMLNALLQHDENLGVVEALHEAATEAMDTQARTQVAWEALLVAIRDRRHRATGKDRERLNTLLDLAGEARHEARVAGLDLARAVDTFLDNPLTEAEVDALVLRATSEKVKAALAKAADRRLTP